MNLTVSLRRALPIRCTWLNVAEQIGLAGTRIRRVKKTALGREVHLTLNPPATPSHVQRMAERIAVAYGVARVRILTDPLRADRIALALDEKLGVGFVPLPQDTRPIWLPLDPLRPFFLGIDDNAEPVAGMFYGQHILIAGSPGAGKSNALRVFLAHLSTSRFVALYGIDPKSAELAMWTRRFTKLVLGNEAQPSINLLTHLLEEIQRRATHLATTGTASLRPSKEYPWICLVIDEWAELAAGGNSKERARADELLKRFVSLGRAVGCTAILCTQRPTSDVIDVGTRSLLNCRFAMHCGDKYQAEAILGISTYNQTDLSGTTGRALWSNGGPVRPVQFYEVSDSAVPNLTCAGLQITELASLA